MRPSSRRSSRLRRLFQRGKEEVKRSVCQGRLSGFTVGRCNYKVTAMIDLEVYAAGVRNLEKILELDHEFEAVPGLRYKVDSNHDIVYLDFDEPTLTIQEVRAIFRKLGLEP